MLLTGRIRQRIRNYQVGWALSLSTPAALWLLGHLFWMISGFILWLFPSPCRQGHPLAGTAHPKTQKLVSCFLARYQIPTKVLCRVFSLLWFMMTCAMPIFVGFFDRYEKKENKPPIAFCAFNMKYWCILIYLIAKSWYLLMHSYAYSLKKEALLFSFLFILI